MPIRPQHRWLYPIDWVQISASIRFGRARGRCERCGRPHGLKVQHTGNGRWWDAAEATWRDGNGWALRELSAEGAPIRLTRVILAAAHLDHDPTNNRRGNLKALRQRCHMLPIARSMCGEGG